MNQMALSEGWQNHDPGFAGITKMAERELAAFFNAVRKLFGAKQAELAAKDWLQELETTSALPVATREWRLITIHAARRLASRLNVSFQRD
ncbi:MAG TPA: hypothetical protein VNK23_02350 [Candidatus Dormibacteraeota bacterium]|nr:hypothetical protein [Candidatus Dormibacteraeota bacterium]